uniref:Uncharacterized protein n=1 Tax=Arundo donax TaxID=35708 RepID=A0A0A9F351_ARUDO
MLMLIHRMRQIYQIISELTR